jgi:hypothetical protein
MLTFPEDEHKKANAYGGKIMTDWELHGYDLANCNCASGCPCQFMSPPTQGGCEAVETFKFDSGHYGDVDLGGTSAAMMLKWPGAIHEGDGTMQLVIDESATPEQRDALQKIMTGEDTAEMATFWWVFSAMCPNKLETLFLPISVSIDIESRTGHVSAPGAFETEAGPLLNPVSGEPHRARIDLPHGFQFHVAEVGRGTTTTGGALELNGIRDSHVHIAALHIGGNGVLAAA